MITKEKSDRLERILSKLRTVWYGANGNLRLCQALFVITGGSDPFYVEDKNLEKQLDEFLERTQK